MVSALFTPRRTTKARVLIVDDEPLIRDELRELLENAGLSVDVAANGREAMNRMGDPPVDVVVTDILLPEMDGIETVREIRAMGLGTKIIAISGGGSGMFDPFALQFRLDPV